MKTLFRTLTAALSVLGMVLLGTPAHAADPAIEAAKADGIVGETIGGYLGIVDESAADPALVRKVKDVNAQRRALYGKLANDTNTTVDQVARITGEKQVAGAESGEYTMDDSGQWTRQ